MKLESDGVAYLDSLRTPGLSWEEALARSPEPNRGDVFGMQEKLRGLIRQLLENKNNMTEEDSGRLNWEIGILRQLVEQILRKSPASIGKIPVKLIRQFARDKYKLWESATPEQFKENGEYNQISLSDNGTLYITVIKFGAVESIKLQVGEEFVEPIREQSPLDWDRTGEGFKNDYTGLGGVYQFVRAIPLLREGNGGHNIDLIWRGQLTNPVIEGGPYSVQHEAQIIVRSASYSDSE